MFRGVDSEERLIYVATQVPEETLQKVNCLGKKTMFVHVIQDFCYAANNFILNLVYIHYPAINWSTHLTVLTV